MEITVYHELKLYHIWKLHQPCIRSPVNTCKMHIVHWFIEDAVWFFPWDGKKQKQYLTSQHISVFSSYGPGAWELKYFYWAPNILLIQNYTSVSSVCEAFGIQPASISVLWKLSVEYLFNINDPCSGLSFSDVVSIVLHHFCNLQPCQWYWI